MTTDAKQSALQAFSQVLDRLQAVEDLLAAMENRAPKAPPEQEDGFIDQPEAIRRVGVCRRTFFSWRKAGIIPSIWIGAKQLYYWPTVQEALLRRQRSRQ